MYYNKEAITNFANLAKTNLSDTWKDFEKSLNDKKIRPNYDKDADVLYFVQVGKELSENSESMPAGDTGISFLINKDGYIQSLVIEDFGNVFIKENKGYEALYNQLMGIGATEEQAKYLIPVYAESLIFKILRGLDKVLVLPEAAVA